MLVRLRARSSGGRSSREAEEVFAIGLSSSSCAIIDIKSKVWHVVNEGLVWEGTYAKMNAPPFDCFLLEKSEISRKGVQGISSDAWVA